MVRESTPRRRSARLSRNTQSRSSPRKAPLSNLQLSSLVERDETPELGAQESIDDVISTPAATDKVRDQMSKLSGLNTPKTQPRPGREQMHPETAHRTTTKAPDSGLKLGFADIPAHTRGSLASIHNTPTRPHRQSLANTNISPTYEFKFNHESHLSREGQQLMDSIREEAARIKAQMQAERELQDNKDAEAEQMFDATGRKIAKPKGKAGRFSDVHMAEFKKMDSIANHPSAYRHRQEAVQHSTQSLKRSGSRAGLDEPERPRTAGKNPVTRTIPSVIGRPNSVSPYKSISTASDRLENTSPAKKLRQSEMDDVSASKSSTLPRPISSSLLSPTKSSMARAAISKTTVSSVVNTSLPNSYSGLKSPNKNTQDARSELSPTKPHSISPSKLPQPQSGLYKPLPALPVDEEPAFQGRSLHRAPSSKSLATSKVEHPTSPSKLPTFSGLRSILRSGKKQQISIPTNLEYRFESPTRPDTASSANESAKKVDFTPSVKSRYAVKLAAGSPSPAKLPRGTPIRQSGPLVPYDSAAYRILDDQDEEWEDEDDEVAYPYLPPSQISPGPVVNTFTQKSSDHNRRESSEFKSIFTTLHPRKTSPPSKLTSINTAVNKTDPATNADRVVQSPKNNATKPSPSTIRRVRASGVTDLVQPFEDRIQTVPHGLPGKKRRHESIKDNDQHDDDYEAKENRQTSDMPNIPGGWEESVLDAEDEGNTRAGKRTKVTKDEEPVKEKQSPSKKQPTARELAAQTARDRKSKAANGRGVLSLSRLNLLSRPKQRN